MKKIGGILATLTIAALLLSACANSTTTGTEQTTGESDTITIGGILPLTGDAAVYGTPLQRLIDLTVEEINAAGGINGKKMAVQWENGECNARSGSTAAQKLIDVDKVQVVLGGFCSSETLALAPIAEAAHVVTLSPGSSNPSISQAGDYIFRDFPSDASQGELDATESLAAGYKKAVVLAEQTDYALGVKDVFVDQFTKGGGEATVETYTSETTDFKTPLLKLKEAGADLVVVVAQTPAKYGVIFKQMEDMDWQPKQMIVSEVAGSDPVLFKEYKDFMQGMWSADFSYDTTYQPFIDIAAKYKEKYGEDVPYKSFAATSYDAINVIADALKAVGNDGEKIKNYFYTVKDRVGAIGKLSFDENGDLMGGYVQVIGKEDTWVPASSLTKEENDTTK